MNTIKRDERERIYRSAVALVENTNFDAGDRFARRRRASTFVEELRHAENISQGRAQGAISTAYRRVRLERQRRTA
jgi:hypothetical protein